MLKTNSDSPSNDADIKYSSIDEVKKLRGRLSLKLLNTLDPFIENILNQTPFVTAYFMSSDDKWSRMGIEGFLYVVKRSKTPLHSLILINKKSENHLVEYLTPEFQMNQKGNFIFYKSKNIESNSMNSLQGLWFFDESECKNTYEKLKQLTNNTTPLQYNFNSIRSLYDNLDEVPLVMREKDKDEEASTEVKNNHLKSIGSFLLDSISLKSRFNKTNEEKRPTKVLEKFKMEEKLVTEANVGGKHLMTLLKTSTKGEMQNSPEESDSDSFKMLNNIDLKVIDSPVLSQIGSQEEKLTITYQTLKSVISEVVNREEFVSKVWEELKKRSN